MGLGRSVCALLAFDVLCVASAGLRQRGNESPCRKCAFLLGLVGFFLIL